MISPSFIRAIKKTMSSLPNGEAGPPLNVYGRKVEVHKRGSQFTASVSGFAPFVANTRQELLKKVQVAFEKKRLVQAADPLAPLLGNRITKATVPTQQPSPNPIQEMLDPWPKIQANLKRRAQEERKARLTRPGTLEYAMGQIDGQIGRRIDRRQRQAIKDYLWSLGGIDKVSHQHIAWALQKAGKGDYRSMVVSGQRAKAERAARDRSTSWHDELDRIIDKMPVADGQKWLAKVSSKIAFERWKSDRLDSTLGKLPISRARKDAVRVGSGLPFSMAQGAWGLLRGGVQESADNFQTDVNWVSKPFADYMRMKFPNGLLHQELEKRLRNLGFGGKVTAETLKALDPTGFPAFVHEITSSADKNGETGVARMGRGLMELGNRMAAGDEDAMAQFVGMFNAFVIGLASSKTIRLRAPKSKVPGGGRFNPLEAPRYGGKPRPWVEGTNRPAQSNGVKASRAEGSWDAPTGDAHDFSNYLDGDMKVLPKLKATRTIKSADGLTSYEHGNIVSTSQGGGIGNALKMLHQLHRRGILDRANYLACQKLLKQVPDYELSQLIVKVVDDLSMQDADGTVYKNLGLFVSEDPTHGGKPVLRVGLEALKETRLEFFRVFSHEISHALQKALKETDGRIIADIFRKQDGAIRAMEQRLEAEGKTPPPRPKNLESMSEWWAYAAEDYEDLHTFAAIAAKTRNPVLIGWIERLKVIRKKMDYKKALKNDPDLKLTIQGWKNVKARANVSGGRKRS